MIKSGNARPDPYDALWLLPFTAVDTKKPVLLALQGDGVNRWMLCPVSSRALQSKARAVARTIWNDPRLIPVPPRPRSDRSVTRHAPTCPANRVCACPTVGYNIVITFAGESDANNVA